MHQKSIYKFMTKRCLVWRCFTPCGNGDASLGSQGLRDCECLLPLPTTHTCLATAGLVSDGPAPSKADLSFAVRELWEPQVILRAPLALSFPQNLRSSPETVGQFKAALSPSKRGQRMTSATVPWSWSHPDSDVQCLALHRVGCSLPAAAAAKRAMGCKISAVQQWVGMMAPEIWVNPQVNSLSQTPGMGWLREGCESP